MKFLQKTLFALINKFLDLKRMYIKSEFNRLVSLGDVLGDRWEKARLAGFGEGTSCYDNVLIIGDVKVGKNCWIGPNVVLDGSGGLEIGNEVSISSGVQIYSHSSVQRALTNKSTPLEYRKTSIGDNVYIGPNSVIQMGVTISSNVTIGALTFVNKNLETGSKFYGRKFYN